MGLLADDALRLHSHQDFLNSRTDRPNRHAIFGVHAFAPNDRRRDFIAGHRPGRVSQRCRHQPVELQALEIYSRRIAAFWLDRFRIK